MYIVEKIEFIIFDEDYNAEEQKISYSMITNENIEEKIAETPHRKSTTIAKTKYLEEARKIFNEEKKKIEKPEYNKKEKICTGEMLRLIKEDNKYFYDEIKIYIPKL